MWTLHGHPPNVSPEGRTIFRHLLPADAGPLRRIVLAGLAALSGCAAYAVFTEAAHSNALDARVQTLTSQNAMMRQQIADRRQEIGDGNSASWLEEQARRLGFVFPGESVYVITTPAASLPPGGGLNAPLPSYAPPSPSSTAGAPPSPSPSATPKPTPTAVIFGLPTPSPSP